MNDALRALMQDTELRKAFGARVKQLRKQRHWTQKELANRLDIRYQLLNKYEGGQHIPPAETLFAIQSEISNKIAEALQTSVDHLLTGNPIEDSPLADSRLFRRFKELEAFDAEDQATVINVIDAIIAKRRVEGALAPLDREAAHG